MKLQVKLFAYFRNNRFISEKRDYTDGVSVANIITDLGIDTKEVGVMMLNARHCRLTDRPCDGDTLAIFPLIGGG